MISVGDLELFEYARIEILFTKWVKENHQCSHDKLMNDAGVTIAPDGTILIKAKHLISLPIGGGVSLSERCDLISMMVSAVKTYCLLCGTHMDGCGPRAVFDDLCDNFLEKYSTKEK